MTQLIKLTAKASKAEVKGNKAEVLSALKSAGASKGEVELSKVQAKLKKLGPKVVRQHVRNLVEEKLITVKKVKAA